MLVVHTWGMGDLIMFTPILKALKKHNWSIDLLVFQSAATQCIKGSPLVDHIYNTTYKPQDLIRMLAKLRANKYDAAFTTSGVKPVKAAPFIWLTGARMLIGEYRKHKVPLYDVNIKYRCDRHRFASNLALAAPLLGDEPVEPRPVFSLDDEAKIKAEAFVHGHQLDGKVMMGIHPGSVWSSRLRRWPKEYFAQVLAMINRDFPQLQLLLFAGPDETAEGDYLERNAPVLRVTGMNIAATAALIAKCAFFFNTDSGLGHIASCFDAHIFTVFGPADPTLTAPLSPDFTLLRLEPLLPCQPCRKNEKKCRRECLEKLTPEYAYKLIKPVLTAKL